nr:tetratricopeptide repeat protein [uncultured Prevotella sp.]
MFLTFTPCNAQRNEKLCCGHKPDSAAIVLNNQAVDAYKNRSNSPDAVKKAMTLLDRAIEKDPDYQLAYANKADFLKGQGDLKQALETLNAYLKHNPIEPYTLMGAGLLYEMLGNKKEVMNYYKRAEENFKRLYEKDHDSAHEINRYYAIRLIEGPEKVKALYKAERDRLASNEEQRNVNDSLVMSIIETPREQFLK